MRRQLALTMLLIGAACVGGALAMSCRGRDLVLYNHSPSMPVGLYARISAPVAKGAIVTVRARNVAPAMAAARGFDGDEHRFIKRIAGIAGDVICVAGDALTVNGAPVASLEAKPGGSASPLIWTACRQLEADQVLLLGETPDSFDGRYWGPISTGIIEGVWRKF